MHLPWRAEDASVRKLDVAKPGEPLIYAGLYLPASALLDTLLLPFAVAAELSFVLQVRGGH